MNTPLFHRRPLLAMLASAGIGTLLSSSAHAQAPTVKGTFLGDGKDAKIQHLVVQAREPFSDKPAIRLIFTEKDASASKKPDFDAAFKRLGSALLISVDREGGIFGCEVAHTAHEKSPFSALGEIKMQDFTVTDTQVSGHIVTGGELDAFGQKWNVDLTFSAPLPKGAFAAAAKEEPAAESKMKEKSQEEEAPEATGPKLPIADLPLPAAASNVQYKTVVEHIAFSADAPLSTVAADFSAKLKQKGWKESPGSLQTKTSAILRRKLGSAELTIMMKPAGKGCTANVITRGLDWSNAPASSATAPKPADSSGTDDIGKDANRLINDALKQIPGGIKF